MSRLLEVWGDTVDSRHLCGSIALGVGIAAPTFLLAEPLFAELVDDPTLAGSYALLTGLVGCLVAGYVSARLFKPKRIVAEKASSEQGRRAALDDIASEYGEVGAPADLPAEVQQELRSLGLYDVLADDHDRRTSTAVREGVA